MDIPATAASTMAAAQDQRLDFRTIKIEANASETNEEKEDETFLVTSSDTTSWKRSYIQGISAGKRGRGRPSRTWERDIEELARASIGEATRMAERRDLWCTVINVTEAQP